MCRIESATKVPVLGSAENLRPARVSAKSRSRVDRARLASRIGTSARRVAHLRRNDLHNTGQSPAFLPRLPRHDTCFFGRQPISAHPSKLLKELRHVYLC
jgi:hypothetical protein